MTDPLPPPVQGPRFSGWRVCSFAVLTQAIAIGFTLGAVGLFAAPLAEDFGMTATQFGLGVSGFSLVMNLSMPVIGRALDRGSIRVVMALGAACLSTSLALLSFATELWQIGLLFCVGCSLGMAMLGPMASSTAMANWFDRLRGRALGLANAGGPFGPFLIVPIAGVVLAEYGWRPTIQGFAVVAAVVGIPAARFGMIDRPSDVGQMPDGDAPEAKRAGQGAASLGAEGNWDARAILRSRDFWFIALAAAPFGAQGIVLGANAIPYLVHHGASLQAASFVAVPMSVGAITGPLVFGTLADRIHPRFLFIGLSAAICACFGLLATGPDYYPSLALFVVCGLVGGSMMPVYGALIGRLFGVAAFGQVMGLAALVGLPVIAAAPVLFGAAFDATGDYSRGLFGLIGALLVSIGLFSVLTGGTARRRTD